MEEKIIKKHALKMHIIMTSNIEKKTINNHDIYLRDTALWMTGVELLSDVDVMVMFEDTARGGVTMASQGYIKASNTSIIKTHQSSHVLWLQQHLWLGHVPWIWVGSTRECARFKHTEWGLWEEIFPSSWSRISLGVTRLQQWLLCGSLKIGSK